MILDENLEIADAVALNTGGADTYLMDSIIDLGAMGMVPSSFESPHDFDSPDVYVVITVDTTATSGGSATGKFTLASDAQAAIATDGTATHHFATGDIPVATLVAGYRIAAVRLPMGVYERYLGILQTTAVAAFTAGKINVFLTMNPGRWQALASGTNP